MIYELTKYSTPGFELVTDHLEVVRDALLNYSSRYSLMSLEEYQQENPDIQIPDEDKENFFIGLDKLYTLPLEEQVNELLGTASGAEFGFMEFLSHGDRDNRYELEW
jgi:hypothetical protein